MGLGRQFGRWMGWNMFWWLLFFFFIPVIAKPQKPGSWLRITAILPSNMGLTYFEFWGFWTLLFFFATFMIFLSPSALAKAARRGR